MTATEEARLGSCFRPEMAPQRVEKTEFAPGARARAPRLTGLRFDQSPPTDRRFTKSPASRRVFGPRGRSARLGPSSVDGLDDCDPPGAVALQEGRDIGADARRQVLQGHEPAVLQAHAV